MNNFLLMLGALLVGILAALVAVPMIVDWNGYRGVFEEEASRLLGRDVRVGGGVNVRILPVPYVRFEKLRIADPDSTGGDPLFRADSVTMRLSVAPLLRGVLEAQSVELKKPSLRLAVDAEGRGNWRSLSLTPGSLPFVPADVSLQSVGIEGGTLLVVGAGGKDIAQFEAIDGELSAEGFEGPYKFKGNASWYGEPREFRLSTAKAEADGTTKVRATVRLPSNQNSYTFEGRLLDLKGKPRIDGELSAKLPIAGAPPAKGADDGANAFELKAKVDGDLSRGQLSEIALSLDLPGDPQLVTGTVKAAWGGDLKFDMALASRSFNLDRFAADKPAADPLDTVRAGLNVILAALPAESQTDAVFKAERVMLAGEPVTGVTIAMNRRGAALEVKELKALLPGNTRLEASGAINRDAKSSGFTGPVTLRGANLARFLGWARKTGPAGAAARTPESASPGRFEGPFALEGQLAMLGGSIELTRGLGEIAGLPLSGDVRYSTEGRRRLAVVLQGQRIDAAQLWPGGFDAARLKSFLAGAEGAASAPGEGSGLYGFSPETADLKVEVRAGELQITGQTNLRDVDTTFSVERGTLTIPRMRFTTAAGLGVDLDGQVTGLAAPHSANAGVAGTASPPAARRGNLRWVVNAANAQAVPELVNAIDWPAASRPSEPAIASIAALGAMRLAGSTAMGERSASSLDVSFDGTIDGGRVTGTSKFDGGLAAWRKSPLDVVATVESGNVDRWLDLIGIGVRSASRPGAPRAGQLFLKAEGVPDAGTTVMAALAADGLSVVYQGAAALPKDSAITLDGMAGIGARDAAEAVALAGLTLGQGAAAVPLSGQVQVKLGGGKLALSSGDLKLGGASLQGNAVIASVAKAGETGAAVMREVDATIAIDNATLPGLLLVLADRRQDTAQGQTTAGGRSVWPDQPLSLASLDGLGGRINLTAGRLAIDGAVSVSNVKASIVLAPGSIGVNDVSAAGLGGQIAGTLALKKAPSGVGLTSDWSLAGANMSGLGAGAAVPVGLKVTVASQGLSPSGLVASLAGRGEASIGGGKVKAVAPGAVAALVDTVLAGKVPPGGDELTVAMRQALSASTLDVAARTIPFTLVDGIGRIENTTFATADGRATVEGSMDFNLMRFSADWRIAAAAKPGVTGKPKAPMPPVVVSASGPLANMAEADSKMTTAAFEQELSVRKLERDVEELERQRKLDEERRQQEAAAEAANTGGQAGAGPAPASSDGAAAAASGASPAEVPSNANVPATGPVAPQTGVPAPAATDGQAAAIDPQQPATGAPPPPGSGASPSGLTRQPAPGTSQGTTGTKRRAQEGIPVPFPNF